MDDAQVAAIGSLTDPTRRRAYELLTRADGPIGRDEVAAALGIGRTLAAFHLDKLAEVGLVEVSFARPEGRSGPGAGRPAKHYRIAPGEIAVGLPPRTYGDLSVLLAEALDRAGADLVAVAVARVQGVVAGRAAGPGADRVEFLTQRGYAPSTAPDGTITLRNCPFAAAAREFPPLICGMNLALLEGITEGAGWPGEARLDPAPGRCCVTLKSKTN
ncbi:putative ArsR family transcriptional regulator [Allocatelliglobosispora scoriae]|uniref:Putative ArsR family transcriptional regulator n=1 Tax=Allocatelliglobosispora scoriae TaxID=643052 RepID=A0A841BYY3_9ACTN|nr:helix-turn-helix domain-containing protein [Allocatelliglobosispora scoriae]MBB5872698.1 putative ArsR family transcriptional regulator [Allocatelliglobosispora scoriae]